MAYCPKCTKSMDSAAVVCPHCGYDFPAHTSGASEDQPMLDGIKLLLILVFVGLGGLLIYMAFEFRNTLNGLI